MTVRESLTEASTSISRRDAETLLAHLLSRDRAWIFAHPEAELASAQLDAFRDIIARRAAHEPLQHLTGQQEFFGLTLHVTRDTLIPRPETELLVEAVLGWLAETPKSAPPKILDVGTGTGAIALALAASLRSAAITATDISPTALDVARDNAHRLHLDNRVDFIVSDLLAAPQLQTAAPFDVIVSNPPYVALADAATLQPEVVRHEPHAALFAGSDGLDVYRRLIPQILRDPPLAALRPGGLLALEFGFGQSDSLRELLALWNDVRILDDYAGIPRIALATRA